MCLSAVSQILITPQFVHDGLDIITNSSRFVATESIMGCCADPGALLSEAAWCVGRVHAACLLCGGGCLCLWLCPPQRGSTRELSQQHEVSVTVCSALQAPHMGVITLPRPVYHQSQSVLLVEVSAAVVAVMVLLLDVGLVVVQRCGWDITD